MAQQNDDKKPLENKPISQEKMLLTLSHIDETICAMQHIVNRLRQQVKSQREQQADDIYGQATNKTLH